MSFSRLHKWVAYLFAALGLFAISIGPYLSVLTQTLLFCAMLASYFVERPELLRSPRWVRGWTIGVVAALLVQVTRGFAGGDIIALALEFTGILQISRLFNRRTAAEYQQITAIALLHLIAATVLSTELAYAAALIGFLIVAPWMLSLGHLRAEIEAHRGRPGPEHERDIAKVLASPDLVGARFLFATAGLAIPLFMMTAVLFVVFPRVGIGFLSLGREVGQRVTGFGANVELGDFGRLRSDPTVVLRVTPPDLPRPPPPYLALRMRGTSFDHYDGRAWTRTAGLATESIGRVGTHYPAPVRLPNPRRDQPWRVVLDQLEEPVIFLPQDTVGLQIPPRIRGGIDVGREVTLSDGVDLRYADADGLGLRYTAYTSPDQPWETLPPEAQARYLQVPAGHERVAGLAAQWVGDAASDRVRAHSLVAHLRDEGTYAYSLDLPALGDRTPLDVFLFEARRGHCEYFSTALAVMLRTQGIPARNVTGFLGGQYNSFGAYYAIRQADAHSWVEAYVDGRWVTLEPTPAGRDAVAPEDGFWTPAAALLDALRTRWNEDVVNYDLRSQISLVRTLRRWLNTEGDLPQDDPTPPQTQGSRGLSRAAPWVGAAGVVLVALALFWLRWRRHQRELSDAQTAAAIQLFRELDRTLGALGWHRPASQAPQERVDALARADFGAISTVREVTAAYLEARFGGRPLAAEVTDRLQRELQAMKLRRELRASSPT